VLDLAGWVAAERTDATGPVIDNTSKLIRGTESFLRRTIPEVPVLAEKAVEGTRLVEDGQVVVAVSSEIRSWTAE
jgi:hypothetical protein